MDEPIKMNDEFRNQVYIFLTTNDEHERRNAIRYLEKEFDLNSRYTKKQIDIYMGKIQPKMDD